MVDLVDNFLTPNPILRTSEADLTLSCVDMVSYGMCFQAFLYNNAPHKNLYFIICVFYLTSTKIINNQSFKLWVIVL
jgi:hypothetical protein